MLFLYVLVLILYCVAPLLAPHLGEAVQTRLALAEEITLDVIAARLGAQLARTDAAFRLIQWSFICAAASSINFQVLALRGISLPKARGTWLEIEINVPYVLLFLLGALAIRRLAADRCCRRNGAIYSGLFIGIAAYVLVPLLLVARPLWQTRIIHLVCMSASGLVLGFGLHALLSARAAVKVIAAGYMSLSCSNSLFQLGEVFPQKLNLDHALDWTWTGGQAVVVLGLFIAQQFRAPDK